MALSPYDQSIYDAGFKYIPQSQYLLNPFQIPQGEESEGNVAPGLPAIYQAQGGGGGGSYTGGVNDLIQNYTLDTRNQYFGNQPTPLVDDLYQSKLDKTFLGMPSYQQQQLTGPDLGEYIGTDTDVPLEPTTAGKIQSTLGNIGNTVSGIMSKVRGFGPVSMILGSMDKFDTLSPVDQEFVKMNMGYTGPTVFGENASGLSKDPYGINTRSAFGNYADYVRDQVSQYEDIEEDDFDKLSKFRQTKVNFYRNKMKQLELLEKQMAEKRAAEEAAKDKAIVDQLGITSADVASTTTQGGGGGIADPGYGPGGGLDASKMGGGSRQARSGGQKAGGTGRTDGGWGWADGGIVDLVDIYD